MKLKILKITDKVKKFKNSKTLSEFNKKIIMSFENKINELNIVLPEAKAPVGSYVATKISW